MGVKTDGVGVKTGGKIKSVLFRNLVDLPSTTYATFGLYRYPAKFIPHVIAYTLKTYAKPGMTVFDPFAGCGTAGVVAKIYGHDYELWDLNPMLDILHSVATMKPLEINRENMLNRVASSREEFIPKWSRLQYWFPEEFLPFLYRVWGYYHSLDEGPAKLLLTIPLLKTTRHFSYDDMQRQKLSKSLKSEKRVEALLSSEWQVLFLQMLKQELNKVIKGVRDYWALSPRDTKSIVKGGIDTLKETLKESRNILITSPPYLQSQEYIRQAKLDLFWLGYPEEKINELRKLEIPYRSVEPCPIHSETFLEYQRKITEQHVKKTFNRYFWGILSSLTRLQENISSYLCLFVGHSSARGYSIPLDKIFIEHLTEFGWEHETTLIDTIVSRRLFSYGINPASKIKDSRTLVENLVVLKRT